MTHQDLIDSAASYALGALDAGERAQFEAHLAGCRECRQEVDAYRDVASALAFAAPSRAMPGSDELRARILTDARHVRPIASARRPVAWLVTAASVAAVLVIGYVYRGERRRVEALRAELVVARAALAHEDSTLAAFVGPEVHVVSLAGGPGQKPALRVFWNHTRHTFVVTAAAMPPAPAGKTYQLWAIRKGKPAMSMGTFAGNPNGRITTTLPVAQQITDGGFIDDCALTVEPLGGSAQPTEAPRLSGSWRHVD